MEVTLPLEAAAEFCSFVPTVSREGERTVAFTTDNAVDAIKLFQVVIHLASTLKEW
jgi:D-aminopeptidase